MDFSPLILIVPSLVLQAARSTKGIGHFSTSERALIALPDEVLQGLVGILFGNGFIVRRSSTSNSRLVYAQTAVAHKSYFFYVLCFFIPFCAKDYIPQSRIIRENRTIKTYSGISFTTMHFSCFNEFK